MLTTLCNNLEIENFGLNFIKLHRNVLNKKLKSKLAWAINSVGRVSL